MKFTLLLAASAATLAAGQTIIASGQPTIVITSAAARSSSTAAPVAPVAPPAPVCKEDEMVECMIPYYESATSECAETDPNCLCEKLTAIMGCFESSNCEPDENPVLDAGVEACEGWAVQQSGGGGNATVPDVEDVDDGEEEVTLDEEEDEEGFSEDEEGVHHEGTKTPEQPGSETTEETAATFTGAAGRVELSVGVLGGVVAVMAML